MDLKKNREKVLLDNSIVLESRYQAAKYMFMLLTFLFFLNYFFVGAKFYDDIFLKTLPFIYVFFLIGWIMYMYFFTVYKFTFSKYIKLLIMWGLWILFVLFLLPFTWINLNTF